MCDLKLGEIGIIQKVNDLDKDLLVYLFESQLIVGKSVKVLEKRNFDNSLLVKVEKRELAISEKISRNIYVEKIK